MAGFAKFFAIHKNALSGVTGLRHGDCWNVALREPLGAPYSAKIMTEIVTHIVTFRVGPDRQLHPATAHDVAAMEAWERRHCDTPAAAFELPPGLAAPSWCRAVDQRIRPDSAT